MKKEDAVPKISKKLFRVPSQLQIENALKNAQNVRLMSKCGGAGGGSGCSSCSYK
jgi:hypothetical protein